MSTQNFQQFISDLNAALYQQNKRNYTNIFKNGFNAFTNQLGLEKLYDLLGSSCLNNQSFFMDKLYKSIYKFLTNKLNLNMLYEMEKYILSKFTLYPNENVISVFEGRLVQNDNQVKGRIYLTKYRLIAHGKWGPTTGSSMAWGAAMSGGGGGGAQGNQFAVGIAINNSIQRSIQRQVQESMGQNFSRACFGYQYPISNHYALRRTRNDVRYRVNIQVQKRNKYKLKVLKLKVVPRINITQNLDLLVNAIEHAPIQF